MKYPTNHMHISNNNNFYCWMAHSLKSYDNCIWFAGYSVVAFLVLCILWIPTKWVMSYGIIMCVHPNIFGPTHKPYSSYSHFIGIDIFWFCSFSLSKFVILFLSLLVRQENKIWKIGSEMQRWAITITCIATWLWKLLVHSNAS